MTNTRDVQRSRQPYCKPELERVQLVPEEAVLTNCKSNHAGGPDGVSKCHPVQCMQRGS
jgi:hypothetical protein